jgi:hypothetical protein
MGLWLVAGGTVPASEGKKDKEEKKKTAAKDGDKADKPSLIGVPIPIADPALGVGLAAAGLYTLTLGGSEKPSTFGVGAFWTSSNSWGAAIGARTHLNKDRLRVNGGLGLAQLNYDFFGVGNDSGQSGDSIPIEQSVDFFTAESLFRLGKHLYLGPRYRILNVDTVIDLQGVLPPGLTPPDDELDAVSAFLGLHFEWDSRDNEFSATRGQLMDFYASFFDEIFASDFEFQSYWFDYNRYTSIKKNERRIVAWRATACNVTDGAPFYELCAIGIHDAFRGYQGGRYRDRLSVTAQAEYRWEFIKRWVGAVFGGVAQVAADASDLTFDNVLPAAGIGFRWMVVPARRIDVRVDYAWGEGDSGLYISVGEAF